MIAFRTSVRIERALEDVFTYLSEPSNFPVWNSAVQALRREPAGYVMERQLPRGRVTNTLEIVEDKQAKEVVVRTLDGPTPFVYSYRLSMESDETIVDLDAQVELPAAGGLLSGLAGRAVKRGVDDNLATLKRRLETAAVRQSDGGHRSGTRRSPGARQLRGRRPAGTCR